MAYEVGEAIRASVIVRDPSGAPADAVGLPAFAAFRDDGTAYAGLPAVVDDVATGAYHVDFTPDSPGVQRWTWTVTNPFAYADQGQAFVRAPGNRIVSLTEAKNALNKAQNVTADDEEVTDWIDAATYVIEQQVGIVVPRTYTETYDGGEHTIFLRRRPVVSITTVTEVMGPGMSTVITAEPVGGPYTDSQYLLDGVMLRRRRSGFDGYWAYGCGNVTVTHKAGRAPTPPHVRTAVLELIGHYWRASQLASRGARTSAIANAPQDLTTLIGIALPNRIAVLLGPKRAPRLGGRG